MLKLEKKNPDGQKVWIQLGVEDARMKDLGDQKENQIRVTERQFNEIFIREDN